MLRYCDSLKVLLCLLSAHFFPSVDCFKENMCPLATAAHLLYDTSNPDVWPASQLVTTLDAIDPSPRRLPSTRVLQLRLLCFLYGTYLLTGFCRCILFLFIQPRRTWAAELFIHWNWRETVKVDVTSPFLLPSLTTASWAGEPVFLVISCAKKMQCPPREF